MPREFEGDDANPNQIVISQSMLVEITLLPGAWLEDLRSHIEREMPERASLVCLTEDR
jgi:hypothetical protein